MIGVRLRLWWHRLVEPIDDPVLEAGRQINRDMDDCAAWLRACHEKHERWERKLKRLERSSEGVRV